MDAERWQRLSPLLDAMFELDEETRARSLSLLREEDPQLAQDLAELPEEVEGGLRLDEETLGLDTALTRLAAVDARLAQVVELRYFAGLSELEIAALLKRSERSIRRDWQKARLFLLASLKDQ